MCWSTLCVYICFLYGCWCFRFSHYYFFLLLISRIIFYFHANSSCFVFFCYLLNSSLISGTVFDQCTRLIQCQRLLWWRLSSSIERLLWHRHCRCCCRHHHLLWCCATWSTKLANWPSTDWVPLAIRSPSFPLPFFSALCSDCTRWTLWWGHFRPVHRCRSLSVPTVVWPIVFSFCAAALLRRSFLPIRDWGHSSDDLRAA